MATLGRLHPLLIHFPIALAIVAVAAEGAYMASDRKGWRTVAIANVRIASAFGVVAVVAGWQLALAPGMDADPLLVWHRWLGTAGAAFTVVAACATWRAERSGVGRAYRLALVAAGALIGVAGHLGGLMVWGADLLGP